MIVFLLLFMKHNGAGSSCAIKLLALYGGSNQWLLSHHITRFIRAITQKWQIQEFAFGVLVRRENRSADWVWGLEKIETSSPTDYKGSVGAS
jgi:hypothetical protein